MLCAFSQIRNTINESEEGNTYIYIFFQTSSSATHMDFIQPDDVKLIIHSFVNLIMHTFIQQKYLIAMYFILFVVLSCFFSCRLFLILQALYTLKSLPMTKSAF